MTDEKALTVQDADFTNGDLALTQFNPLMNQEMIVQLGDNLMGVHPAAKDVGKLGMRTVAQLALMTGANPLPGTNGIHVWVDNKQKICIQFGMGFWRGKVEELGGFAWVDRPRPMTDEERVIWGVSDNEVGFICRAATWEAIKKLRLEEKELGGQLSLKEAREMLYKEGVGVVGLETWGGGDNARYKEQKQGRSINWTAAERAERDLCRKLAPIFTPGQHAETKRLSAGPAWDGLEQHDADKSADELNGELFSTHETAVDAEYEEVETAVQPKPDNEPEQVAEPEPTQEPEETAETDNDLAGIIADCRSWLQEKIKDDLVELGLVMDAAAMTPLFDSWKQAHNALTEYDFPEGFKLNRKQTIYGKPALVVYDWLIERAEIEAALEAENKDALGAE